MSTENVAHHHEEGAVLLEQNGPIAMITLSRPAALNAMTWTMYQQLEAHLDHHSWRGQGICSGHRYPAISGLLRRGWYCLRTQDGSDC